MMVLPEIMLAAVLGIGPPQHMDMASSGGADGFAINLEEARVARARLSLMRADGAELAWIEGVLRVPAFDGRAALPDVLRFEAPVLEPDTGTSDPLGRTFRFEIDRNTALRDGGISGDRPALSGDDGLMRLASLASGEGEYDIYDLSLAWDAYTPGPLTVSVIGGIKAIDARINRTVTDAGGNRFEDARGVAAVPVIGGGVSWRVSDDLTFSGTASTQSFSGQGSVVDFSAETSLRLAPNIGLSAGYQFIRGSIEVESLSTELEREGVFARIQIRF